MVLGSTASSSSLAVLPWIYWGKSQTSWENNQENKAAPQGGAGTALEPPRGCSCLGRKGPGEQPMQPGGPRARGDAVVLSSCCTDLVLALGDQMRRGGEGGAGIRLGSSYRSLELQA